MKLIEFSLLIVIKLENGLDHRIKSELNGKADLVYVNM